MQESAGAHRREQRSDACHRRGTALPPARPFFLTLFTIVLTSFIRNEVKTYAMASQAFVTLTERVDCDWIERIRSDTLLERILSKGLKSSRDGLPACRMQGAFRWHANWTRDA